jgi:hypothetical protein
MSDLPPDQISADELRALEILQHLKGNAESCGHQFAGQLITPSGTRYLITTHEPENIAAWIFEAGNKAMNPDATTPADRSSRKRLTHMAIKIKQVLSDLRALVNAKHSIQESHQLRIRLSRRNPVQKSQQWNQHPL